MPGTVKTMGGFDLAGDIQERLQADDRKTELLSNASLALITAKSMHCTRLALLALSPACQAFTSALVLLLHQVDARGAPCCRHCVVGINLSSDIASSVACSDGSRANAQTSAVASTSGRGVWAAVINFERQGKADAGEAEAKSGGKKGARYIVDVLANCAEDTVPGHGPKRCLHPWISIKGFMV